MAVPPNIVDWTTRSSYRQKCSISFRPITLVGSSRMRATLTGCVCASLYCTFTPLSPTADIAQWQDAPSLCHRQWPVKCDILVGMIFWPSASNCLCVPWAVPYGVRPKDGRPYGLYGYLCLCFRGHTNFRNGMTRKEVWTPRLSVGKQLWDF